MNEWKIKKESIPLMYPCSLMAEIVLKHGSSGLTQERLNEVWNYNEYPMSVLYLRQKINNKKIKWYIHNHINIEDNIWNADFIHGLTKFGRIRWLKDCFPSLYWEKNETIYNMLMECPFYGNLFKDHINFRWMQSPALCLKYKEDSISFMAGVLATGKIIEYRGFKYIGYNDKTFPYLKKWNIPIEHRTSQGVRTLISPFWPAVFSKHMPSAGKQFLDIKKPYNAHLYAGILYRIYVSNDFETRAIPYLKSRRWAYNSLGTVEETELKWLKLGISQIDKNIRKVIQKF